MSSYPSSISVGTIIALRDHRLYQTWDKDGNEIEAPLCKINEHLDDDFIDICTELFNIWRCGGIVYNDIIVRFCEALKRNADEIKDEDTMFAIFEIIYYYNNYIQKSNYNMETRVSSKIMKYLFTDFFHFFILLTKINEVLKLDGRDTFEF